MFFLGIDAGTTCIKAAILLDDGQFIDSASVDVSLIMPSEDACELDMIKLWNNLCSLLQKLRANNSKIWNEIKGIGITGQGDGFWAIDKKGVPVRNAILWNDTRTKHLKLKNREEIDGICIRNDANPLYAGSNIHILRWLKEFEPDVLKCIQQIFHCKDWLNFKLTGVTASDYSDMTTALMNLKTKKFSGEIMDALDLSGYTDRFASPVPSDQIIGSVTENAAEETGLKRGIPVIAGAIDVAAVAVGLGVIKTGDTCIIAGTTLANQTVIKESDIDFDQGLVLSHISSDNYICIMPTLNGAAAIDWVKKLLYPETSYDEIETIIRDIPIGSRGLIYHPYLHGERAPFRNPYASGSFFGLKATHSKEDLMRAAFEGLAMSLSDCFASLPRTNDRVFISGGASKNSVFCQMASDCLGKSIVRIKEREAGIKGIISVVKTGLGLEKDLNTTAAAIESEFTPDSARHEKYENLFELFQSLRYDYDRHWLQRNNLFNG